MGQDANEIQRQIELTRERIGETMDAIAYKVDVGARLRENLSERLAEAKVAARRAAEVARKAVQQRKARA